MSKPCSQLNSKVIRDKAECHIIAAIEKKCSVVAFKCVWRVHDDEIERAWSWICEKRDECDLTYLFIYLFIYLQGYTRVYKDVQGYTGVIWELSGHYK